MDIVDKEIEERGEFAKIFAKQLLSHPEHIKDIKSWSFEQLTRVILIDCDLDLDFVTMSQLYEAIQEDDVDDG